ncbi:MAG: hypothetical protein COC17_03390 [Hyphomicrobiales bacterium]|nr:MAG: hypothetical protein COC17_03390 [Hyphomicrobiales bacterium]
MRISPTTFTSFISAVFIAFIMPNIAIAQSDNQQCQNVVSKICGGSDANVCFENKANWKNVPEKCEGDVQTLIEMANEAHAQMAKEGASWGGVLRSGPSREHNKIGSLAEGQLVTLEQNTKVMFNGYPWFEISIYDKVGNVKRGYQWGGILCAFDKLEGVFQQCPIEWSDNPARRQTQNFPKHGNSDEDTIAGDNAFLDRETIDACLASERSTSRTGSDGTACIGKVSAPCLAQDRNYSTTAMRQCVMDEHKIWDDMLNADYKKLMASLDTDQKKNSLKNAQRTWNKFVKQFCKLGYEFNQGTMFLVTGDDCLMRMTARQDLELKNLLNTN